MGFKGQWCRRRIAYFFHEDGNRLIAGNFDRNGLNCNNWNGKANDNVGFFLLMVCKDLRRRSSRGVFCFVRGSIMVRCYALDPFPQHTPSCGEFLRELNIFVDVQSFYLPQDGDKILERIKRATQFL